MTRDKIWKLWLIGGSAAIVMYFTVARMIPHGTEIYYFIIGAGTACAIIAGIRLNRPARACTWWLLSAGMALWALGDGIYNGSIFLGVDVPYPSASDPLFLLAYPVFGVGLVLHRGWQRRRGTRAAAVIEVAIITLSASLASWVLIMRPYLDDPTATLLAKIVSIS